MAKRELQVRVGVNLGDSNSQLKALNVNIKNTKSEFEKAEAGMKGTEPFLGFQWERQGREELAG